MHRRRQLDQPFLFGVQIEARDGAQATGDRGACASQRFEPSTERFDVGAPRTEQRDSTFCAPLHVLAEVKLICLARQSAVTRQKPTSANSSAVENNLLRFTTAVVIGTTNADRDRLALTLQSGQSACVRDDAGIGDPLDAVERASLCDLMGELGPGAPTLLSPWTTHDLAAHLVIREHDYRAAPGLVVPGAWGRFAERRRRALTRTDYATLLTMIRSGPPPGFFRLGWVRRVPNLNEFFVHHEDVRRANGLAPRANAAALDDALWRNVGLAPWFLARRLRVVGLDLERVGTSQVVRAHRGTPTVLLTGLPGELLLYLFGRQRAAIVEVTGPREAVAAVERARFGI
jgi:uncharacterized protein (TIGR03085 family)